MNNKQTVKIAELFMVVLFFGQATCLKAQIAKNYPHDHLIHSDPNVIFTEMFEEDAISAMMLNWNQKTNIASNILFDPSVPAGSLGAQSLKLITIDDGTNQNENTFIYKKFSPDVTDSIFVRYYIKYDTKTKYHHSGVYVGGKNPPASTAGLIGGVLPLGNKEFHVGTEIRGLANGQASTNALFGFYNYWMGMHPFTTGPNAGSYFGNEFFNTTTNDNIDLDSWNCIEMMIKLNNPVSATNGALKLWINGILITNLGDQFPSGTWSEAHFTEGPGTPFEGFQWRNDAALNLNYIWLKNFNDANSSNHVGTIYFDHLVVAKKYIGPIAEVVTGINELKVPASISIYPNPASDLLKFTKRVAELSIFDLYGRTIMQQKNVEVVSVNDLEAGVYIIQADHSIHKLVVNH